MLAINISFAGDTDVDAARVRLARSFVPSASPPRLLARSLNVPTRARRRAVAQCSESAAAVVGGFEQALAALRSTPAKVDTLRRHGRGVAARTDAVLRRVVLVLQRVARCCNASRFVAARRAVLQRLVLMRCGSSDRPTDRGEGCAPMRAELAPCPGRHRLLNPTVVNTAHSGALPFHRGGERARVRLWWLCVRTVSVWALGSVGRERMRARACVCVCVRACARVRMHLREMRGCVWVRSGVLTRARALVRARAGRSHKRLLFLFTDDAPPPEPVPAAPAATLNPAAAPAATAGGTPWFVSARKGKKPRRRNRHADIHPPDPQYYPVLPGTIQYYPVLSSTIQHASLPFYAVRRCALLFSMLFAWCAWSPSCIVPHTTHAKPGQRRVERFVPARTPMRLLPRVGARTPTCPPARRRCEACCVPRERSGCARVATRRGQGQLWASQWVAAQGPATWVAEHAARGGEDRPYAEARRRISLAFAPLLEPDPRAKSSPLSSSPRDLLPRGTPNARLRRAPA
jgi:hypothetical protein